MTPKPRPAASPDPASRFAGPQRGDPRFLTPEKLREASELLFFAYRDFTGDADNLLKDTDFGRAHHRALHFIRLNPGLAVADLLAILKIKKQSLARVLSPLIEQGYVTSQQGMKDGRQRLLHLTEKGTALEDLLAKPQHDRLASAYREAGAEAVAGFRQVLALMIDETERDAVLAMIESGPGQT